MDEAFDVAHIAEARALGVKLAAAPAAPPPAADAVKSSVLARNGLLTLLSNKVALVRKGAAHVFRAFPETYREVTSTSRSRMAIPDLDIASGPARRTSTRSLHRRIEGVQLPSAHACAAGFFASRSLLVAVTAPAGR